MFDRSQGVTSVLTKSKDRAHKVSMEDKTCGCGKWQLFHYPCSHALAVCEEEVIPIRDCAHEYSTQACNDTWASTFNQQPNITQWKEYVDPKHIPSPIFSTLLYKQPTHRSTMIWEISDTNLLTVRHRGISWDADEHVLPYITRPGFGPWYYMQNYEVNWSFMTSLVERWRSETHTFHLHHGEMTITLEDVRIMTRLPIEGRAMTTHQEIVPAEATELEVQRYSRAYILGMLGSSLLPNSSGSEISLHYLPLLADLDSLSCYSWGVAVLAYLYRKLWNTCDLKATQPSGCGILLQLWAWEHLITGRPRRLVVPAPPPGSDVDPMRLPSLGYTWNVPKSFMQTSHHVLMLYGGLLDRQEANIVIWTPYTTEILAPLNLMCVACRDS
ncbi:hypothetical protein QQ045_030839 [Rhodiola kirilowii]